MNANAQSAFLKKTRDIISSSGVPFEFSPEVIKEAADIESEFKWSFIGKRADLRGKTTFTLGSLEVAFSVERQDGDFILGIHSADVSKLFPLCSPLDEVAFLKGKSVILPEKKYPMIPESIASGFCSLEEGEECFTVSVFLKITESGKIKSVDFFESVIKVTANCEPEEVEALFFNIDVSSVGFLRYKYQAVLNQLEEMFLAGAILKSVRESRGAEEVDTAFRTFSKKGIRGNVVSVNFEKLSDPKRLVREVISAAGMEIAKFFKKEFVPCPNRFRPPMSKEGNDSLREFLKTICINTEDVKDENLVGFASNIAHGGKNEELILEKIKELLPSSSCSLEGGYHCGIASEHYVRFAYPASRYGDLCVQRLMKAVSTRNREMESLDMEYLNRCASRAVQAVCENEPKAKALENRISDLYALDFLSNNKNKNFEGTVWSVSKESVEICLDNSCKGILKSKGEFVPGQRCVFRISDIDWEKETAFFEVCSVSLITRV